MRLPRQTAIISPRLGALAPDPSADIATCIRTKTHSIHNPSRPDFAKAFNPKSVAVVGASRVTSAKGPGWSNPSGQFIPYLLKLGYKGNIYPVNPKADEILGLKCYPSVSAIPEVPEMVTVSVPARFLANVLEDCASVGALNVHVFTSGFSETSTTEGVEMEKVVREVATRNHIRVVGPNCLGVHSPAAQFSTIGDITNKSGSAAFVAQSGGHANGLHIPAPRMLG